MALNDFRNITKDDILGALGLETRRTTGDQLLSGLLMMGIGLAAGIGIGMLLAPKSGSELRNDLTDQYRKTVGMAQDMMSGDKSSDKSSDIKTASSTTSRSGTGSSSYSNPV
jgi:gas vesicle protein